MNLAKSTRERLFYLINMQSYSYQILTNGASPTQEALEQRATEEMKTRPITYKEFLRLKPGDHVLLNDNHSRGDGRFICRYGFKNGKNSRSSFKLQAGEADDWSLQYIISWRDVVVPEFAREEIHNLTDYDS